MWFSSQNCLKRMKMATVKAGSVGLEMVLEVWGEGLLCHVRRQQGLYRWQPGKRATCVMCKT
jgi:hypothetical protein